MVNRNKCFLEVSQDHTVTKPSSKPFEILSFKKERHVKLDFTDQNIRQRENLIELNFEGLEIQKRNVPTDIIQIVDE